MHKLKSTIALSTMLITTAVPVLANVNIADQNTYQDIQVTANISSSWVVTLPKSINLTCQESLGSGEYTGDI